MAVAIDRLLNLNLKVSNFRVGAEISFCELKFGFGFGSLFSKSVRSSIFRRNSPTEFSRRFCTRVSTESDLLEVSSSSSSSSSFEDFIVISSTNANGDLKLKINVSGSKTQTIFDDVFSKLVTAAQPIPGFRRLKGGKTADIPKDILMHILGPSKVYKQSIMKIVNTTVSDYVAKEGLKVSKDLQVDETFEELEAVFKAGKSFVFSVTLRLLDDDNKKR